MCVWWCAWDGVGRGDVVKTRPLGEQDHGGVGQHRHTSPQSRKWQGGNISRTSGAGRWVGRVLGVCRRTGCMLGVKKPSENSPHEPVRAFQKERKSHQTNFAQPRIGCWECLPLLVVLSTPLPGHTPTGHSPTTEHGGVYQHEATDTPNDQMQTNRHVQGPNDTQ